MIFDFVCFGVVGFGCVFMFMVFLFDVDICVKLMVVVVLREESCDVFEKEYGGIGYVIVEELCVDFDVEVIYIVMLY